MINRILTVGGFTLLSRITGFARDIILAAVLGAGPVADAFFVALRLPNHFRAIFAEGAFNAAFVPAYARIREEGGGVRAGQFADRIFTLLLASQIVLLAIALIFTPAVIDVLAPGFARDPERFKLAVELTRITFPYLLLITLVTLYGGILNALQRFAAAAAAPILLNLSLILALALAAFFPTAGHAAAWGVLVAGILEFLLVAGDAGIAGVLTRFRWPELDADVRKFFRALGPAVVGSAGVQLALFADTIIASFLPTGALSALYYADRLNQLPLGVVGIAVGTAILPSLSRQVRLGHLSDAVATQNRGIELAVLLTLPAAIALGVLATPILSALFERGAFGSTDTAATAAALAAYAAGLPAFVLIKVLAPAFFARHDTATPVKVAVTAMAVNLCLTLVLMQFLAHVGIALATTVAGWLNALVLLALLIRRRHFGFDRRARRNLPRVGAAALAMGVVLAAMRIALAPMLAGHAMLQVGALAVLVCAGLATFAVLALGLGIADWRDLLGRLRRQPA
jgi:putative peptidoglycan lipid II flippase